jgi:hypothetical protein
MSSKYGHADGLALSAPKLYSILNPTLTMNQMTDKMVIEDIRHSKWNSKEK